MMKKLVITALLTGYCLSQVYAVSLSDLISKESIAALEKDTKVINVSTRSVEPQLVPDDSFHKKIVQEIVEKLKPTIMVENLYLYRKPASRTGRSWTETEQTLLYNEIRALSTLTGIEYYSASRGKMRIFYEYSSVIDGPDTKKPIPDPVVSVLPKEATLFARQKDLTFGDNLYQYDYMTTSSSIVFIQTNLTTLSYGIIPLVRNNNLKSIISIIDVDEGLLLYAATFAKASTIPGVEGRIRDSFSNRIEAVYKWFVTKADTIFIK